MARAFGKRSANSVSERENTKIARHSTSKSPPPPPSPSHRTSTPSKPSSSSPSPPQNPPKSSEKSPESYDEDIYHHLIHQEEKRFRILDPRFLRNDVTSITPKLRRILIDWIVQVHSRLELAPETLHLAVSMIDRMLELRIIETEQLQILGISAMFLSSKFEEIHLPICHEYELIAGNSITKNDIFSMEKSILSRLQFDLSAPSSLIFTRLVSRFLEKSFEKSLKIPLKLSIFFGELGLMDVELATVTNAEIGSATWILALKVVGIGGGGVMEKVERKKVEKAIRRHLGKQRTEMRLVVEKLARAVHRNFTNSRLFAVRKKYESTRYGNPTAMMTDEVLARIREIGFEK